jgi:hypothetical protein
LRVSWAIEAARDFRLLILVCSGEFFDMVSLGCLIKILNTMINYSFILYFTIFQTISQQTIYLVLNNMIN